MPSHPFPLSSLVLGFALLGGCSKAPPPSASIADKIVSVRVAVVEQSTATPVVRAPAVLARQTEADLSFPVAGILDRVLVRPGDRIKRGQELASIQPDTIDAQMAQAVAARDKTRRDLARIEKLQAERVATLENLQDARTAADQAAANVQIAEFARRHSVIKAPSDGVVLRRLAEPSELVAAGRPVLTIAGEEDGWIAKASLSARDASRVTPGTQAEFDDGIGGSTTGKVIRIAAAADPATRTVPVEILLDAPMAASRSGLVVSARIMPAPVAPRAAVPLAALRDGNAGRAFLFVVDPGTNIAKRLGVDVELIDGDRAFLRSPLAAGQRVVISGSQYLIDGAKVKISE